MTDDGNVLYLEQCVEKNIDKICLEPGSTLVVAVSGGPDSLAMLYSIFSLRNVLGIKLHGAHLDHGIRGERSERDADFVKTVFDSLKIPSTIGYCDLQELQSGERLPTEQLAREARYKFLATTAVDHGAKTVLLGHTSDDQAETILMHIMRGSGVTGLSGIKLITERKIGDVKINLVRPLINISRMETLEYCKALKLKPVHDETNSLPIYDRNRLRIELLPMLEKFNPKVKDSLIRLSYNADQIRQHLDTDLNKIWQDTVKQQFGQIFFDVNSIQSLSNAMQTHLLRHAIEVKNGTLNGIYQSHIDSMIKLIYGRRGRTLDLPGNLRLLIERDILALVDSEYDAYHCPFPSLEGIHKLSVPGKTTVGQWDITVNIINQQKIQNSERKVTSTTPNILTYDISNEFNDCNSRKEVHFSELFSYSNLGTKLYVRNRNDSDSFQPLGMNGNKSIQDFMVDSKIPKWWRSKIPLVTNTSGIAWVVGWRISEWAKVLEKDTRCIEICFATTLPNSI